MAEKIYGEKAVIQLHAPVHSQEEADELAKAELTDRNNKLLKGSGECIGIPEILPGRCIKLSGMGSIFSRPYYIKSSRHSINNSGYKTTFQVEGNSL